MARWPVFLATFAFLASSGFAQNLIKTAPACGKKCDTLIQAYMGCVPAGGAPAAPESTYVSCFCASTLVGGLYSDPASVCADTCTTPSQQQGLAKWYQNYCAAGGNLGGGDVPSSSAPPSAPTTSSTTSGGPTSTGTNSPSSFDDENQGSWWSEHSKWIAMVIVLIIGFAIIIGVAIYLKRRHYRKRNRANSVPSNSHWGPNASQIHVGGGSFPSDSSLQKEKYTSSQGFEGSRGATMKLKKLVGR